MGVERVLLLLLPRREGIGNNGVPGGGRSGASGRGVGHRRARVSFGTQELFRGKEMGDHGGFVGIGMCQFRDGGPGFSAPPFRAGGWGFESALTSWEPSYRALSLIRIVWLEESERVLSGTCPFCFQGSHCQFPGLASKP